mgnify:CR=1 FL=1
MYQELHKWEESIQVAETKQHPEVATLKANYFQWLAETGQEEKAAVAMQSHTRGHLARLHAPAPQEGARRHRLVGAEWHDFQTPRQRCVSPARPNA